MRPSFFSKRGNEAQDDQMSDWHFDGENLSYGPSFYGFKTNENNLNKHTYFMNSFEYDFKYIEDEIICAYTVPYSYSDLMSHLG